MFTSIVIIISTLAFLLSTLVAVIGVINIITHETSPPGFIMATAWAGVISLGSFLLLIAASKKRSQKEEADELLCGSKKAEMGPEVKLPVNFTNLNDTYTMKLKKTSVKAFLVIHLIVVGAVALGIADWDDQGSEIIALLIIGYPLIMYGVLHENRFVAPFEGQVIQVDATGIRETKKNIYIAWNDLQVKNHDKLKCVRLYSKENPNTHFAISQYIVDFDKLENIILQKAQVLPAQNTSSLQRFEAKNGMMYVAMGITIGFAYLLFSFYSNYLYAFLFTAIIWLPLFYMLVKWTVGIPVSCVVTEDTLIINHFFKPRTIIDKDDIKKVEIVRKLDEGEVSQHVMVDVVGHKHELFFTDFKDPLGLYSYIGKLAQNGEESHEPETE